jgi:HTH-type transcriptional regulator / antitoxin HigA
MKAAVSAKRPYRRVLDRINDLMDADPGTPAGDELDMLVSLVEHYEKEKHLIDLPDHVKAPRFRKWSGRRW